MNYVTEFETAALFVDLLLIVIYAMKRNFLNVTNKIYIAILFCATASTALDLISVYTLAHVSELPIALNYAVNILYLLTYCGCAAIFYVYVADITKKGAGDTSVKVIAGSSLAINLVLLVTTPITGWIISFPDNVYTHGPLFIVIQAVGLILLILSSLLFCKYRKNLSAYQSLTILSFIFAVIFSVGIQIIWQELLLQNFVVSLFLVLLYISLQNPDYYMDVNTRCFNRQAFYETLEKYINKKTPFKLVGVYIDGLRYVNSLHGLKAAGEIIDASSLYFRREFGKNRVFHISDSRYAILTDSKSDNTAERIIEKLKERFASPVTVEGSEIQLTPRISVLSYPEFEGSLDDISDALDYGFRSVSRSRDSVLELTTDTLAEKRRESMLTHIVKRAIRKDEFNVYYQPIRCIADGQFHSAEALIRLFDDELGYIEPEEFIPICEKNGMILSIGETVFRKVCRFLSENDITALGADYIEVNLSTVQCIQEQLAEKLTEIMKEYGVKPEMINFEITETADSENKEMLLQNMNALLKEGCSFSMDDYGTGFSTAYYLIT
ncbi:MAG: EAL domain-containing protein, partial [Firmicutes bacterium]|nr:EAL domain-containing protein [Bacillota bacterium]